MKNSTKNRRLVIAMMLVAVVLITIGGTFAYFLTTAGRNEEQKLTIKTGNLALTFEDNDSGLTGGIMIGESKEKLFIIRNTGTQSITTNMIWDGLVNTYLEESLSYTLEYKTSEDGTYQSLDTAHINVPQSDRADGFNLAKDITIPAGETYYYKLTITFNNLPDINQEADRTAILSTKFNLGDVVTEKTVIDKIIASAKSGTPTFANAATTDEGIYSMQDDYGTSYYYRGAVTNNYVKFGGFFWRIIRINGDGSVRMQYDGTQAYANGDNGTEGTDRFVKIEQAYNVKSNDAKYVGYMYGPSGTTASTSKSQAQTNDTDSDIKNYLETDWYVENIEKNAANSNADLSKYLGDEIFCNDRSTATDTQTWWTADTKRGFGTREIAYGGFSRFVTIDNNWNLANPSPTFVCPQKNDAFTVSDTTKGNGFLKKKIGLIIADEIIAAGGVPGTPNKNIYLYKSSSYKYWSLSPYYSSGYARVFSIGTGGTLSFSTVNNTNDAVAPVINIAPNYAKTMVGEGTMTSPYQIPGVD